MSRPLALTVAMALAASSCAVARTRAPLPTPSNIARTRVEQSPPAPEPDREWAAPTVTRSALANAIPLFHVPHSSSRIAVRYCNTRAGEDDLSVQAGLASITATMLAEGSRSHPGEQLALAFAALGANLSITTGRSGTCVDASADAADFERLAALVFETIHEPEFDERAFNARRVAQMDERASTVLSRTGLPRMLAHEFIFGPGHPYGRAETGLGPEIRARTVEQLRQHHRSYYRPAFSAVIVAGGDQERARSVIDRTFGRWAPEQLPAVRDRSAGTIAPRRPARVHIIDTGRSAQTHLLVVWPGPARDNQDWATLIVLERILGGMFSSRLNLALREDEGYAYGAYSALSLARFGGLILARSNVETTAAARGLARLLHEVRLLRETEVSGDELAAARALEHSEFQQSFASPTIAARTVSELFLFELPLDYHTRLERALRAVSARDVMLAAQRYMPQSEMLAVLAGPRDELDSSIGALSLSAIEHWSFQR